MKKVVQIIFKFFMIINTATQILRFKHKGKKKSKAKCISLSGALSID